MRDALLLLADRDVPIVAVLGQAHAGEVLCGARLQHAAAAEVVAKLPRQNTRHVPAREVGVGHELSRPLREANETCVALDALVLADRVARLRAPGIRLALANIPLLLPELGRNSAQEHEVVWIGRDEARGIHDVRDRGEYWGRLGFRGGAGEEGVAEHRWRFVGVWALQLNLKNPV